MTQLLEAKNLINVFLLGAWSRRGGSLFPPLNATGQELSIGAQERRVAAGNSNLKRVPASFSSEEGHGAERSH